MSENNTQKTEKENVWYVQALKELSKSDETAEQKEEGNVFEQTT